MQDPVDGSVADAAIEECAAVEWGIGLAAVGLLRALPALERAEHRLAHMPESLRREVTGWSMLSNLAVRRLDDSPDPFDPLAPLMAMAEADRLEDEMAAAVAEDTGADAPVLEEMLDCASFLRSTEGNTRVAVPLLEVLADAVYRSLQAGDWSRLPAQRARYLRRWNQLSRTRPIPRLEAQQVRPYLATCRLIGKTVAGMHHRAGMVSHAVFLENFDEQGAIRNLGAAEWTSDPAEFAEDLVPLRFQLWGRHLEEFQEGYLQGYGADRELAWMVLVLSDRLARTFRGPGPRGPFPTRHLQMPHYVVRATGDLLRSDSARRPDFTARLQAVEEPRDDLTPAERLEEATTVLVEAADLDRNASIWAASLVQNTALELLRTGQADQALFLLEGCLYETEDTVDAELLDPVRGLVWVLRAEIDEADRATALRRAATWFTRAARWDWARNILEEALAATDATVERAELQVALLRAAIDAALATSDGEHLHTALARYRSQLGLSDELTRRLDPPTS